MHKPGWQKAYNFQKRLLRNYATTIIIINDLFVAGLRKCGRVWRNVFKDALNLDTTDNRLKNVSWKALDISLRLLWLCTTALIIWTKINQKILQVEIFQNLYEEIFWIKTIITGMLPIYTRWTHFGEQKAINKIPWSEKAY